jgi:putative ABC transport system ATP-binding protein
MPRDALGRRGAPGSGRTRARARAEPTASLDSVSGRAVAEALAALARERGVAVLVATHDVRLREFATRRLWTLDGELRPGPA